MTDDESLSVEAKQALLDTVAEFIASTIDGACRADVHATLSHSRVVPVEWRDLVQEKVALRRQSSSLVAQDNSLRGAPMLDWECPRCGSRCTAVDARTSLRSKSTAKAVQKLSADETSGCVCPLCGEGRL